LVRINGHIYIANVDIGGQGLLRRLGLLRIAQWLAARFGRKLLSSTISWDDVELLPGDQPMRLRVSSDKIAELHPADLAEIISDLNRAESSRFLEALDVKTVAEALEEVEPDFQASLLKAMPDEKAADVLEEMAPDEAADLLAQLPEDRSQELLSLMVSEDAEDVRKLLAHPEDSAGGIMTTEFVAMRPDMSAEQAISALRDMTDEAETVFYIYVTDDEDHLRFGLFRSHPAALHRLRGVRSVWLGSRHQSRPEKGARFLLHLHRSHRPGCGHHLTAHPLLDTGHDGQPDTERSPLACYPDRDAATHQQPAADGQIHERAPLQPAGLAHSRGADPAYAGPIDHHSLGNPPGNQLSSPGRYSTVTLLARLRGWSTSQPRRTAR
jgi:hypothetical protein